ncbi:hypothetical protein NKG94_46940 [Micromonospora sp. M12]
MVQPAQSADSDQGQPATDQQSVDLANDESTADYPDLSPAPATPEPEPSTPTDVVEPVSAPPARPVSAPPARPVSGAPRSWADDLGDDRQPAFETGSTEDNRPVSAAPSAVPHHQTEADAGAAAEVGPTLRSTPTNRGPSRTPIRSSTTRRSKPRHTTRRRTVRAPTRWTSRRPTTGRSMPCCPPRP